MSNKVGKSRQLIPVWG